MFDTELNIALSKDNSAVSQKDIASLKQVLDVTLNQLSVDTITENTAAPPIVVTIEKIQFKSVSKPTI